MRAEAAPEPKEIMRVLYNNENPQILYGHIAFYKPSPETGEMLAHKESAPFVISETIGAGDSVVLGSAEVLLQDVRRLLDHLRTQIDELHDALKPSTTESAVQGEKTLLLQVPDGDWEQQTYTNAKRRIADTLILISTQSRNLFHLFPRLNRKVTVLDYDGKPTGKIKITELFNQFVHNRYFYIDGEHVSDLFSANPRDTAPISKTFMGYKFNWIEFIYAIEAATREVKMHDLIGLLGRGLKNLSPEMPHADVIHLIQNLHSFSDMFSTREPGEVYGSILTALFSRETEKHLHAIETSVNTEERIDIRTMFHSPRIGIHPELSKKQFRVQVKCRFILMGDDGRLLHEDQDFRDLESDVKYTVLLSRLRRKFGNTPLLDFRP